MKKYDIAVVGATGAVGEVMLEILAERKFPVGKVHALASARSVGKTVAYGNRELPVADLAEFDFSQVQIGLFSAGGSISEEYAPQAAAAGCVVVGDCQFGSRQALVIGAMIKHRERRQGVAFLAHKQD